MIDFLMFRGTGSPPGGDGVCRAFTDRLDKRKFNVRYIDQGYPATYGAPAYGASVAQGVAAGIEAIRDSPNICGVGGYSQGATVAGNIAARIGRGELPGLQVSHCALIADPLRARNSPTINPGVGGYGIGGSRPIRGIDHFFQVAASGDPICALPENPLRALADLSEYAGPDLNAWMGDLLLKATNRNFQGWWNPQYWRDWPGAVGWLRNYLPQSQTNPGGGRHTGAYLQQGLCTLLADRVNATV